MITNLCEMTSRSLVDRLSLRLLSFHKASNLINDIHKKFKSHVCREDYT